MDPDHAGERLKHAIKAKQGTIRGFESHLRNLKPRPRGSSRQTLYKYFNGEIKPPPAVLQAAAKFLQVRLEWLLHGEGGMTEEEEEARRAQYNAASVRAGSEEEAQDWLVRRVHQRFPDERIQDGTVFVALVEIAERIRKVGLKPQWLNPYESGSSAAEPTESESPGVADPGPSEPPSYVGEPGIMHEQLPIFLGEVLAAPFHYLPFDSTDLSLDRLRDYVTLSCQALHRVADELVEQRMARHIPPPTRGKGK